MKSHYPVVIIGGGQAGLSISYCLKEKGIEHIVFEKFSIAHSWQSKRWDSFCLVTPNWQCTLPGFPYAGDDPYGFMGRDDIVQYVRDYAAFFQPNIQEGVGVEKIVWDAETKTYSLSTSEGHYTADQVVIATGGYHRPKVPRMAERLPQSIVQLHTSEYQNPESLPDGEVLIVGTGQSGCQIAEDLHLSGRTVHLCVGGAPRSPREYRGKDVVEWLDQMGYYDISINEHPQKEAVRTKTNHYVTGRGGGREIDLRQFATEGMQLYGRLESIQGTKLSLRDDLAHNLDQADGVAESIKRTIDSYIEKNAIDAPTEDPYRPAWEPKDMPAGVDLESINITTVIWATGYHMTFDWIDVPIFNGKGYPTHERGVTTAEGLYFLGLPWLYTWGSGRFSGVARDATYLADYIAIKHQSPSPTGSS
ncbi:MAG: MSMEG_0569 family flavin-dependent oxidoreductase, partial [Cyanobacteria bacterium P01_F01_bin.153]